jgi:hypothetical protein
LLQLEQYNNGKSSADDSEVGNISTASSAAVSASDARSPSTTTTTDLSTTPPSVTKLAATTLSAAAAGIEASSSVVVDCRSPRRDDSNTADYSATEVEIRSTPAATSPSDNAANDALSAPVAVRSTSDAGSSVLSSQSISVSSATSSSAGASSSPAPFLSSQRSSSPPGGGRMYEAGGQSSTNSRPQKHRQQQQQATQSLPTTQTLSDLKKQRSKLLQQQLLERAVASRTGTGNSAANKSAAVASGDVKVGVNGSAVGDQKLSDDPMQFYINSNGSGDNCEKLSTMESIKTVAEICGDEPSTKNGVGGTGTGSTGTGAGRTRNQEDSCCIVS